jgi:uncharacterized membrane protein required for colicin V production
MVWYDGVILALLVYSAWNGAQKGLITQLAWIAALILCFKFADKLAPMIEPQINVEQPLRHWIAMFVLYIGFSLGSFMVARIMNSWLEKAKFKDFDKHLGGILGLLKGAVIALVVTFFAVTLSESLKATVLKSYTGIATCEFLDRVEPLTPDYFRGYRERYMEELATIHNEHLGNPTTFPDLLGGNGPTDSQGQGSDGFNLPDFFNGLGNKTDAERPDNSGSVDMVNTPTFDQLLRELPTELRDSVSRDLQTRWNTSTAEQKQNLMRSLEQSLEYQLPNVVRDFLTTSGPQNGLQGSDMTATTFQAQLQEIGDIYGNREVIVQRTMERLTGVPAQVRDSVINDWYADIKMQPSDPDTTTTIDTLLDERILRQVDRAGVWPRLSLELQQRLNKSRR